MNLRKAQPGEPHLSSCGSSPSPPPSKVPPLPGGSGFGSHLACVAEDDGVSEDTMSVHVCALSGHFSIEASVNFSVSCTVQEDQKLLALTSSGVILMFRGGH